jgi:ketosteroid isomerase-like protein
MSQENVDLFRGAVEAVNRRDIEGALQLMDPEVRFEHRLAALQGNFVGSDAVRGWFADLVSIFGTWHVDCADIRDLGDRVVVLGTIHTTGKESGVGTDLPLAVVAEFRDGLVIEYIDYGDRAQALEAAGLSE